MNEENEQRVNVRMARRQQQKKETQRRLIKIGSAVAVCLVLIGAVTALYFHGKNSSSAESSVAKTSETTTKKASSTTKPKNKETASSTQESKTGTLTDQLQTIMTDYTKKLEEQTPRLIEEYQAEIQNNQNGVMGLSAIANQKARALQAISDEGISKLQATYQAAPTKEGVDLANWINQLSADYTEQVAKISDIYLRTSASVQAETSSSQTTSQHEVLNILSAFIGYIIVGTIKALIDGTLNFLSFFNDIFLSGLLFIVFYSISYLLIMRLKK